MGNNHKTWYNLEKNPLGIRSYLGNDTFGKLSVGEIIIWEKIHLGKYPTALYLQDGYYDYDGPAKRGWNSNFAGAES